MEKSPLKCTRGGEETAGGGANASCSATPQRPGSLLNRRCREGAEYRYYSEEDEVTLAPRVAYTMWIKVCRHVEFSRFFGKENDRR